MDPFWGLMGFYMDSGCAVHSTSAGFIAAVGKVCGRTLYRVHRLDDFEGTLVRGKAIAMATLTERNAS